MGLGFRRWRLPGWHAPGATSRWSTSVPWRCGAGATFIVVDRLEHLRRGGRIGTAAALLGTALAMKPVLHVVDGKLVLREKTRTSSKALAKLVDAAVMEAGEGSAAVAVHHSHAAERAEDVVAQLKDRIPI